MTSGDKAGALTDPEAREAPDVDSPDVPVDADVSADADVPADAEPDPAEPDPAEPDPAEPASAGAWAVSVAVLCALLIAGAVTAGIFWSRSSSASASSNGEQAAIAAAKTAVTDLTTVSYRDPNAFDRLKSMSAGQFLSTIGNASSGFAKILSEGKVQDSGHVVEAGLQSFGGTTAQVAVLDDVTVKNSQTPQGSERVYRLKVSLIESGSKWLVSNVEFVQ